jgi:hypothetical protein
MAALLTTTPLASASFARSIVRTTSSSSSGSRRIRPGSRPEAATASRRNWLRTVRMATPRIMSLSRISPPDQAATTGSVPPIPAPICKNGGSTKKASMARIATKTSSER